MTTANQIISRTMYGLGQVSLGDSVPGETFSAVLDSLNDMVNSWNTERLFVYTVQEHTASLSSASLTIGSGGTIDTDRPLSIEEGSFVRLNNVDYPLQVITGEQYAAIPDKTTSSTIPEYVYLDGNVPTATAYFWPVPSASVTVHLRLRKQLSSFTDGVDYDLPQGYVRALVWSLQEEVAPMFGRDPALFTLKAAKARSNIKRVNSPMEEMASPFGRAHFNIWTGR